ncbi:MAG TPA: GNAT family N-acetyltransferase [Micromonosporaceae bacterium]|nr:GNAT family N-acetyltransferase [Micromonosporaceae bacterium]
MSPEGFSTRLATAQDLAAIVEIEAGPETTRYLGVTGRQFHERALADPDQEQIVGDVGGVPVGFVVLAGIRDGNGQVELRRIVVSHRHRGAGYGRRLFRSAVSRAYRQHGARQVWLDVKPDNVRGRALYASEGFIQTGRIPDPMDPGGELLLLARIAQPLPTGASAATTAHDTSYGWD